MSVDNFELLTDRLQEDRATCMGNMHTNLSISAMWSRYASGQTDRQTNRLYSVTNLRHNFTCHVARWTVGQHRDHIVTIETTTTVWRYWTLPYVCCGRNSDSHSRVSVAWRQPLHTCSAVQSGNVTVRFDIGQLVRWSYWCKLRGA